MYLVTKIENSIYTVLDTSDMSEENISKDSLIILLEQGYQVYGVSLFSIENNIQLNVVLRLYGEDSSDIKDFDGYTLQDYNPDMSTYTNQIIDFYTEYESLSNLEIFRKVLDALQTINKVPVGLNNLNKDLPCGYIVYARNSDYLVLKDLSDNELYNCDFYTCLYIYVEEGKSIQGVDFISIQSLIVGDVTLTYDRNLEKYWLTSCRLNKQGHIYRSAVSSFVDRVSNFESFYGVNNGFNGRDMVVLEDICLPLYNLEKVKRVSSDYCLDTPWFIQYGNPISFSNGCLYFDNGVKLSDTTKMCEYLRVFNLSNELCNEVFNYIQSQVAKSRLLNIHFPYEEIIKHSCHIKPTSLEIRETLPLLVDSCIRFNVQAVRTEFGNFEILNVNPLYDKFSNRVYSSIWMLRLTHCGSCWFDLKTNSVVTGTMTALQNDCKDTRTHNLCNEEFTEYVNYAELNGITYHNNTILPLCVTSFTVDENSVEIKVACLISDSASGWGTTCFHIVEIPLIYLGGKFVEYEDCFKYYTLFQVISLDKNLMSHLYGSISDGDIGDLYFKNNKYTKVVKELYNYNYKQAKKVLEGVLNGRND